MTGEGFDGLDDIPDDLPEADRRLLLGQLDDLRGLLGDRRPPLQMSAPPRAPGDEAAIPILLEAVTPPPAPAPARAANPAREEFQPSLFGDDTPATAPAPVAPPPAPSHPRAHAPLARSPQDNPYLPQSIKERLAQSQARATRELRSLLDADRTGPIDRRDGANWQKAQQRVKSRAAVIIEQVVAEHLPRIEEDLRRRLKQELEQALRDLGVGGDQPPPP